MRVNPYVNDLQQIGVFCDALVISILGAIVLSLLLEAPVIGLEKILLQRDQNISQTSTLPENVNQHSQNEIISMNTGKSTVSSVSP
ncbi:hypothetical protein C0J52_05789 [Blattella germanica]|nr:hypothetical protein C0J52_05789 [Blattella germanica]